MLTRNAGGGIVLRLQGLSPTEVGAATALSWRFDTREMVTLAVDWLGAGWDTPTLCELASVGRDDAEARALWPTVLDELGAARPERTAALHVLSRWLIRRWEQDASLTSGVIERLRDVLTHGAYLRAGSTYPWPPEHTLKALAHVGHRLDASRDDALLREQVRGEIGAALGGAVRLDHRASALPAGVILVDRVETLRRLVAVAPDFSWDDVELDDNECSGTWEHEGALLRWMTSRVVVHPPAGIVEPMAAEIEVLLTRAGPTASMWATDFLNEFSWHATRHDVDVDAVADALGPVARPLWSDRVRYWGSGKRG